MRRAGRLKALLPDSGTHGGTHGAEAGRGHGEVDGGGGMEGAAGDGNAEETGQIRLWTALNVWRRILNSIRNKKKKKKNFFFLYPKTINRVCKGPKSCS